MEFKTMTFEDILDWCDKNNKLEWLLAKTQEKKQMPVYPQVEHISATGKKTWKMDRKAKPIDTKDAPLSPKEIKIAFCKEFMAELLPAEKPKKPTLEDLVKARMGK